PCQLRLVTEFRHEIATVPFYPSDFIFGKLSLPPRRWFRANLRKIDPRSGVTAPELSHLGRGQHGGRIELDLQIGADLFHRTSWFAHQLLVRHHKTGDLSVAHPPGQSGGHPPMGDYVIRRKPARISRLLERNLCRKDGSRIAHCD